MQKIKAGLLSYGMSGKVFHAPFLELHPRFELTGSWERSKKLIQQDYPDVKSYESFEELLSDDVDLVIVNTPIETHFEYTKKVLEAGKHALVEKAFTCNASEAEELRDLAKAKGLKLVVYHNRRWDSDFKTVKEVVDEKLLGTIVEAEFRFDRYNPNLSTKTHKETKNPGAGILMDLGSHIIDQALHLFGIPDSVFADLRITRKNSLNDDMLDILLYYPDKRVRLRAGFFFREPVPAYALHGTKGSFLKSRGDIQEDELKTGKKPTAEGLGEPKDKAGILHTEKNGEIYRGHIPTRPGNYYALFDALYHSVTEGKKEPVTAQDGVNVMKIIDAAVLSSEEQKVIQLK